VEETTDFERSCGMVYYTAVDRKTGVSDEDFNVWRETAV
jgi:hypothetical protein